MSAEFVPFLQSINSRLAAKAPAAEFSPLPEGQSPSAANPAPARHDEVKVELKRDGDAKETVIEPGLGYYRRRIGH